MRKQYSRSRTRYMTAYRLLRRTGGSFRLESDFGQFSEAEDCALLSYDYHDSHFSGWINNQRWQRWDVLRSGLFNRWELPF